jgi:hypothetical protein
MKLHRKLYLSILVLLPLATSGVMGLGLTRWLGAELEAEFVGSDLRTKRNRLEALRSKQERERDDKAIPRLPEDPGVADFLSQIERAAGIAGISCDEVNVPKGQLDGQQNYIILGKGEAGQIANFLALLEVDARLPISNELRVYSSKEGKTAFELELIVFHKMGEQQQ